MRKLVAGLVLATFVASTTTPALAGADWAADGCVTIVAGTPADVADVDPDIACGSSPAKAAAECAVFAAMAGSHGRYAIDGEGDVFLGGTKIHDCAPGVALTSGEELDPLLCAFLVLLRVFFGQPDFYIIYITPEGDVYVIEVYIWDCPPYEDPPGVR
ncbi:MAG TPA: hypothetical protein VNQ77_06560 [Frankiaceae bacterium]|nr:hypothetical protein [Frankiaceae bacterium]